MAKTGSVQSIENEILTALMSGSVAKQETAEVKHADMSNFPLSYAQMGVYVDCMKQPTSTVYNIPAAIRFPKGTDAQLLSKSVETIIQAHPQFHVHFDSQGADIIQTIDANQPVVIAQSKLGEAEIKKYMTNFVQPFNLRQGPLYRMEIVTTEESVYLLADVHHLIFDGASFDLFLDQLCDLMNVPDSSEQGGGYDGDSARPLQYARAWYRRNRLLSAEFRGYRDFLPSAQYLTGSPHAGSHLLCAVPLHQQ